MTAHGYEKPVFRQAGDTGIIVEFGDGIDPVVNSKVRAMAQSLKSGLPEGIVEIIPTYRSLLFIYDPSQIWYDKLTGFIEEKAADITAIEETAPTVVEIPVCYGGELGPDIGNVCDSSGLDEKEVIRLHCEPDYLIYMVGFTPGFPFLGGLADPLHTPRLKTPRMLVPEGSVGIANNQTGMYPIASPGGWQLIGWTPFTLFAPEKKNPFLYKAGDRIRFVPISADEYQTIKEKENASWTP